MVLSLEQLAAKYELPGQIVRLFAELRALDPRTANALASELMRASGAVNPPLDTPVGDTPNLIDIVRDCYEKAKWVPLTKDQIVQLTGLPENSIHTMIYRSHSGHFESLPNPDGGRAKVYRFKGADGHDVK